MVDGSLAGTLLRLVVSLAVVLLLLVFLARYLNGRQGGTGRGVALPGRRKPAAPVEVLSRHGLTRGSSLAVVRAGGQLLLVGVTETSVSVLRELEEEPEPVDPPQDVPAGPVAGPAGPAGSLGSVVELLREWTTRRG
jgi:flagellar biogenesis protein FliO